MKSTETGNIGSGEFFGKVRSVAAVVKDKLRLSRNFSANNPQEPINLNEYRLAKSQKNKISGESSEEPLSDYFVVDDFVQYQRSRIRYSRILRRDTIYPPFYSFNSEVEDIFNWIKRKAVGFYYYI